MLIENKIKFGYKKSKFVEHQVITRNEITFHNVLLNNRCWWRNLKSLNVLTTCLPGKKTKLAFINKQLNLSLVSGIKEFFDIIP